jgi:pimeloyl-ACP methyl ester carboxylesterase
MPLPPASPDRYLPVPSALLRYRDEGRGPAVLLIHGWTLDLEMWEPQVAALRGSFRLVRLDRRGFGLSGGRASLEADAQDVLALCDSLRLERFACLGMSQGARVAMRLCRIAPERLSCIVLDGPPRMLAEDAAANGQEDVPLAEYRDLIARGDLATLRRRWLNHPLMRLTTDSPQARALLEKMTARYRGEDLLREPAAPQDRWDAASAASLRTPALIVTGAHDLPARVRAADALAAVLPAAGRAIVAGAGHLPNLDNPLSYDAILRAFLERHAGPRH